MADTFTNDLRLRLQESGGNSGQWGDLLNTTITNLAEAFSYGSEAIANASTHTITLQDGTSDEARSMYLKCTGGGQACTVTLAPNTVSKLWFIENATSYTLTFSQGSGANVAVAAGAVKVIATDGAGSGAAVYDALVDLDLTGTTNLDVVDIDGAVDMASTLAVGGAVTIDPADGVADDAYALFVRNNEATDGRNYGLVVRAGSNSSDESFSVRNHDNSATYFKVRGDGNVGIGTSSITSGFKLEVTGDARFGDAVGDDAVELGWSSGGSQGFIQAYDRGASAFRDLSINNAATFTSGGNVGIGGQTSPNADLHIGTASAVGDTTNPALQFGGSTTYRLGMYTDAEGGYIENKNGDNGLIFKVKTVGEAMRISSGGLLMVSTSSDFASSTVDGIIAQGTNKPAAAFSNTAAGQIVKFYEGGSLVGSIGTNSGYMVIGSPVGTEAHLLIGNGLIHPATSTGGGKDASIDIGGSSNRFKDLYLSGGAYLGGTTAANKLDDYEEGTWTPILDNVSTSYSTQSGGYTKVGNLVTARFVICVTGLDTTDGSGFQIGSLPFTVGASGCLFTMDTENSNVITNKPNILGARPIVSSTGFRLTQNNSEYAYNSGTAASGCIVATVHYFAA